MAELMGNANAGDDIGATPADAPTAAPGPATAGTPRPAKNDASAVRASPDASAARSALPVDPRAVRVRLAAASRIGDEGPILVSPAISPLRMTNPTVGRGPFGGTSVGAGDPPVVAQRQVLVDEVATEVTVQAVGHERFVLVDGAGAMTRLVLGPGTALPGGIRRREVIVDGFRFEVDIESDHIAALRERATRGRAASAHGGPLDVRAIIPGKVVAVSVAAGDTVIAGQQLLVVEAMKMQNELRAPRDGTIDRVGVAPGVTIDVGDLLVVIS